MKTLFNCGHKGLGKYCHRCEQAVEYVDLAKDLEKKDPERAKEYKAKAEKLFAVPQKVSTATAMPSEPVPV
jgi:hypothetical protein